MKRYIITSAQACSNPLSNFWLGLKNYSKLNNAQIIVLPMIGISAREDWDKIVPELQPFLLKTDKRLNSNLYIRQSHVQPQNIDPATSQERFAQRTSSTISASPKQRLKAIPHSNNKYPKYIIFTGSVTKPNYASGMHHNAERRRRGNIAKLDHEYGAIFVDIVNDKEYRWRNILADTMGKFVDLGIMYDGNKRRMAVLDAMVLGDIHVGSSDPVVLKVTKQMVAALKPKRLILHDFFDGHSVSHHMGKQPVRQRLLQQFDRGHHSLDVELKLCHRELVSFAKLAEKVYIVWSNHHDFLPRYLEEVRFANDMRNYRTAVRILGHIAAKDYNDGVKFGISLKGKIPSNVRFLREDDDLKVRGYQLAAHGHKSGGFGGFGSIKQKENSLGKSITGHCHSSEKLRQTYTVGTCLPRNMFYMRGQPSKWTHTHALLWSTGTVQLIHIINGKWR